MIRPAPAGSLRKVFQLLRQDLDRRFDEQLGLFDAGPAQVVENMSDLATPFDFISNSALGESAKMIDQRVRSAKPLDPT